MPKKRKLTDEERISAVTAYMEGKGSCNGIAKEYGIDESSLRSMIRRAKAEGIGSLRRTGHNKKYSCETKINAVNDYLSGNYTLDELCTKYKITDHSILRQWILCYNRGKDFKERTRSERGITMNKGRKTTQEERVEIVAFCIEHGKDYGLAMEKYSVSYQQIYSWVRKYEAKGVEGLNDRRGKAKPEDELTEADRLRMENKILQAKIKDQEMEIKLLKKLKELEGGDQ